MPVLKPWPPAARGARRHRVQQSRVLLARAQCDAGATQKARLLEELDEEPALPQFGVERSHHFLRKARQDEVGGGVVDPHALHRSQTRVQLGAIRLHALPHLRVVLGAVEGRQRKAFGDPVVPEVARAELHEVVVALAGHRVADAGAGQRVELREGAQHENVGKLVGDVAAPVEPVLHETEVGLVQEDRHAPVAVEHGAQIRRVDRVPGGVVGRCDQEHPCGDAVAHRQERVQIVAIGRGFLDQRVLEGLAVDLIGDGSVVPPRGARHEDGVAGVDEEVHGLLQDVLAAVAQDDPLLIDTVHFGQPAGETAVAAELEIARVVVQQFGREIPKHGQTGRGRAVVVLVAVERDGHAVVHGAFLGHFSVPHR